jgi:hypothetical protein
MKSRYILVAMALAALASGQVIAPGAKIANKTAPAKSGTPTRPYVVPKTPWGDPDIQGLWPGAIDVPVQRAANLGDRNTLTEEEYQQRLSQKEKKIEADAAEDKAPLNFGPPSYWVEYYKPGKQASLVVDPPNGRIPALTPEATKRIREMRGGLGPPTLASVEKVANSYEDFNLWDRCITRGLIGSMMPGNLYNKGNQIVQAPGYVVIRNEMVHEARVIPIDKEGAKRPHVGSNIKTYMGDGRGHWEGNTLVIETTNFTDKTDVNNTPHSQRLKLIEKFTRVSADELDYDVTIDDPETWTKPWTMHIPYPADPTYVIYEYACHEANYGLINILAGARAKEAEAGNKK